jgi:hypothetical protein
MYYPKSQIKTNLITNGKEFVYIIDNQPYSGSYWRTSEGKYYTGKNPNDTPTFELILAPLPTPEITSPLQPTVRIVPQEGVVNSYLNLKGININNPPVLLTPVYALTIPTQSDYTNGFLPNIEAKESQERLRALGDVSEQLLRKAIEQITGVPSGARVQQLNRTDIGSTLDSKVRAGVMIESAPMN